MSSDVRLLHLDFVLFIIIFIIIIIIIIIIISSRSSTPVLRVCTFPSGARGGVVVKALRYKPAGRGFDSRCCH